MTQQTEDRPINGMSEREALLDVRGIVKRIEPIVASIDRERWMVRGALAGLGGLQVLNMLGFRLAERPEVQEPIAAVVRLLGG